MDANIYQPQKNFYLLRKKYSIAWTTFSLFVFWVFVSYAGYYFMDSILVSANESESLSHKINHKDILIYSGLITFITLLFVQSLTYIKRKTIKVRLIPLYNASKRKFNKDSY